MTAGTYLADAPTPQTSYRCWICLGDEESLEDMISPCSCVGTNQWVHHQCLKTYCLQYLAMHPSPSLRVPCPICRTDYQIVPRTNRDLAMSPMTWRQLLRWTNTDRELLQRHCRYLLLVAPLLASTVLAWRWMYGYWDDLWYHGDGPPLMTDGLPTAREVGGPPMLRSALTASWLPEQVRDVLQGLLQSAQGLLGEAEAEAAADEPPRVHPAGISRNWSMLYVWLQYVQWYKVLCWLLIMVIGGSDGLLPPVARDAFRIEELLLTSDARAQLFIFGQCCPFVVSKLRHFLVTWTGSAWPVQLIFYSVFSSHIEVAFTLTCDTAVGAALLYDWLSNMRNDFSLRLNLNRLRSGLYDIASHVPNAALSQREAREVVQQEHEHAQ